MAERYEYKVVNCTTNPPTEAQLQADVDRLANDGWRLVHTVSSGEGYVLFFEKPVLAGSFGGPIDLGVTPGAQRTGLNPPPK